MLRNSSGGQSVSRANSKGRQVDNEGFQLARSRNNRRHNGNQQYRPVISNSRNTTNSFEHLAGEDDIVNEVDVNDVEDSLADGITNEELEEHQINQAIALTLPPHSAALERNVEVCSVQHVKDTFENYAVLDCNEEIRSVQQEVVRNPGIVQDGTCHTTGQETGDNSNANVEENALSIHPRGSNVVSEIVDSGADVVSQELRRHNKKQENWERRSAIFGMFSPARSVPSPGKSDADDLTRRMVDSKELIRKKTAAMKNVKVVPDSVFPEQANAGSKLWRDRVDNEGEMDAMVAPRGESSYDYLSYL